MRRLLFGLMMVLIVAQVYSQNPNIYNIVNNKFKLSWLEPQTNAKSVGKYEKLEFGIRLNKELDNQIKMFLADNNSGLNPYNPEDISVEIIFESPSYKSTTIYGFFYQEVKRNRETWEVYDADYNWRVRFSPNELGNWRFTVKVYVQSKEIVSIGSKFKCIESDNKGIIKRNYKGNETDRYFYLSESKETFFTIGHNIAHSAYYKLTPQKVDQHKLWLTQLAENGGNFFRLELGAQNALPNWNNYRDYTSKMGHMWEFDHLIDHANDLELYFILFRHHTEVEHGESWDVARWANNPFKKGFDLEKRKDYFTDDEIIKWQKNELRYIFSRWGYNSSFAFYEYQEIDNWYKELKKEEDFNDTEAIQFFTQWYLQQKEFIKNDLGSDKLLINTYATTPDYEYKKGSRGLFANSDAIGIHKYGQNKDINFDYRSKKTKELFDVWNKPIFVEEMGVNAGGNSEYLPLYKCSKSEFHNAIWSTSFMGLAGTGMTWWWDRGIHDYGYFKDYNALAKFFKNENLEEEIYTPQKWHNKLSINKTTVENYAMKNKAETKVLGWVHNATHYWRNIESECLNELLNDRKFKKPVKLKDGYVIGNDAEGKTNYNVETDAYSKSKGVQKVGGEKFEIKGLKTTSVFTKRKWYEIVFYSTVDGSNIEKQTLKTNMWGRLKPKYPEANAPDYSYKVKFIGEEKKAPQN
jgi:hypothetical protein